MRRLSVLLVVLAFAALGTGCKKPYLVNKAPNPPLSTYGSFIMLPADNRTFINENMQAKDENDRQRYIAVANDAGVQVTNTIAKWFQDHWKNPSPRKAKVQVALIQYHPGSGAARFFVGGGVGNGQVSYEVRVWDAQTNAPVARATVTVAITGGTFGGDKYLAFHNAARVICKFFNDNSK